MPSDPARRPPVNGRLGLPMRRLRSARLLQGVVVLLVVVGAASPIDETMHDLVFRYLVSHEVRLLANGFTLLGTTEAGVGILGGLALVAYRTADPTLWPASLGGLAGLALGGVTAQVVKHLACRARPRLVDGWGVGETAPPAPPARRGFFHGPCFGRRSYHSFPSGHANTAFTVAAALSAAMPTRRRAWLTVAAGVAASRVLLNAHFVSDVLAGGLIGWWAGEVGLALARRRGPTLPRRPVAPATAATAGARDEGDRPSAGTR